MLNLYSLTREGLLDYIRSVGGGIAIYRPVGGIGDAAMILPAVTALRKAWGDVPIIMICIDYIEPVFRHHPDIDVVVGFTQEEINRGDHHFFTMECSEVGCEVYKLYDPCPGVVYESEYSPYITKSRQDLFAEACDVEFDMRNYRLELTEEEKDIPNVLGLNDRYMAVHLRSHDKWRDYPKVYTKALLGKLYRWGKKQDIQIVTIDSTLSFEVKGVQAFHHMHLNTIFGILNKAMLVVGPDSSMVHLAGALGRDVLGIFGPTNPMVRLRYQKARWLGKFSRCNRQYCWYIPCSRKFCLSTLSPAKVMKSVRDILEVSGGLQNEVVENLRSTQGVEESASA